QSLGPVIGGFFIGSQLNWRWTMWVVFIAGLSLSALSIVVFPQTYTPAILRKKATYLRKKYRNPDVMTASEKERFTLKRIYRIYLNPSFSYVTSSPVVSDLKRLFTTQPILALLTLYQSFIYGVLFLFYQSYPIAFGDIRGWKAGLNTLPLLAIIIGTFVGTGGVVIYNQVYLRHH
ncbi:hypothetical protein V1525DRAFT_392001, partial [Lipomyces kononenkoae]